MKTYVLQTMPGVFRAFFGAGDDPRPRLNTLSFVPGVGFSDSKEGVLAEYKSEYGQGYVLKDNQIIRSES